MSINGLHLPGCVADSMLHYLKALGILRLTAEQKDPQVSCYWEHGAFILCTSLNLKELYDFFLHEYEPTPLISPWNAASGFYRGGKENKRPKKFENLRKSTNPRFAKYKDVIEQSLAILNRLKIESAPSEKSKLRQQMRSRMPDEVVLWLDALCVCTGDKNIASPVLGTSGNDGRWEMSYSFMQRLQDVIPLEANIEVNSKKEKEFLEESKSLLKASLLGQPAKLEKATTGQFNPSGAAGPNCTSTGFKGGKVKVANPWDCIFLFEGVLLLAGSITRRSGITADRKAAAFPFVVELSTSGWGTLSSYDIFPRKLPKRGKPIKHKEIWLPLWEQPTGYLEITHFLNEGRAQIGRRQTATGADFIRSVVSLGTDRGLTGFSRFAFVERRGQGYAAVPSGQISTEYRPIEILEEIDPWLRQLRFKALEDNAPARLRQCQKAVDDAIFKYCRDGQKKSLQDILIACSNAELVIAQNLNLQKGLHPLPVLSSRWFKACEDGSVEYRLAAAIALLHTKVDDSHTIPPLRCYLSPQKQDGGRFIWDPESLTMVWGRTTLERNLSAILQRRCQDAQIKVGSSAPVGGCRKALLSSIHHYISGNVRNDRLSDLIRALSHLRRPSGHNYHFPGDSRLAPPAINRLYALCKLTMHHKPLPLPNENGDYALVHPRVSMLARLRAGDGMAAVRLAEKQLRSRGYRLIGTSGAGRQGRLPGFIYPKTILPRIASALLFPLGDGAVRYLMQSVLRPNTRNY